MLPHHVFHRGFDLEYVKFTLFFKQALNVIFLFIYEFFDIVRIDIDIVSFTLLRKIFAHDHACDDGFGDGISAQAVKAVHIPARSLAGAEKSS